MYIALEKSEFLKEMYLKVEKRYLNDKMQNWPIVQINFNVGYTVVKAVISTEFRFNTMSN